MKKLLLLLLLASGVLVTHAQVIKVNGKVTDQNNLPVPNSTVREKGTKNGTSADAQGVFVITVKPGAKLIME